MEKKLQYDKKKIIEYMYLSQRIRAREIEEKKKEAHLLQTQYNTVLEKLKEMKDEYEWEKSVNREFDCME